ncbi:XdhC family protein [Alteromonas halophila]|uniref:Xanthine and CO dehydrogenase family maturation factor XdhC/CoxF family protein n=1 Tax=Alteromonas halophila TaxID=516698 RepID=A0A918MZF0_9ALTE|nr:XdhC/CoxI family protein [Alteromonas halophila]GGW89619.1 xanthine and CO dehydrogenase family maturation factor XdhC/CoxF family protein [Alteromonas halophila]
MHNHLLHMLRQWQPLKQTRQWVLGVIYKTEGSCYRKAGAMMLISDNEDQLGVLSGGCLETDIHKKARRVMTDGSPRFATYDDEDEHDIAFQLGVGCGGVVHVALLPVSQANHYLQLDALLAALEDGQVCDWQLSLTGSVSAALQYPQSDELALSPATFSGTAGQDGLLVCRYAPVVHLLLVGAGLDAGDVANCAQNLGWKLSVWDPRPGKQHSAKALSGVTFVEGRDTDVLKKWVRGQGVHAAVLMSHHRDVDASALAALADTSVRYIAMLGPPHRRREILALAGVSEADVDGRLYSPAGLNIGGELPESIALSVIAECHAVLYKRNGASLSGGL